jgi:hypothetical protein
VGLSSTAWSSSNQARCRGTWDELDRSTQASLALTWNWSSCTTSRSQTLFAATGVSHPSHRRYEEPRKATPNSSTRPLASTSSGLPAPASASRQVLTCLWPANICRMRSAHARRVTAPVVAARAAPSTKSRVAPGRATRRRTAGSARSARLRAPRPRRGRERSPAGTPSHPSWAMIHPLSADEAHRLLCAVEEIGSRRAGCSV